MKVRLIFPILLFLLINCKKKEELLTDLMPGEYTGSLAYFTSVNGGEGKYLSDSSISDNFKTTITKAGSKYILSFDKSYFFTIPDISVEVTVSVNDYLKGISTIAGQEFSSFNQVGGCYQNLPCNYFSFDKYVRRLDCVLTIKSNNPNNSFFLTFLLLRIY